MAKTSKPEDTARRGNPKQRPDDQRGARKGLTTMPQPHGGSIGQEPYVPTERDRAYVRDHAFTMGQKAVARRLGISTRTLYNHFKAEIDEAELVAQKELGETAMKRALAGDSGMLRFVLATRFPETWSPKLVHAHMGRIQHDHEHLLNIDLTGFAEKLSDEQLRDYIALIDGLLASGSIELPGAVDDGARPAGRGAEAA